MATEKGSEPVLMEGWHVPRLDQDLAIVVAYTLATAASICLPAVSGTVFRTALGMGMVLFMPGYALIATLFPGRADVDVVERIALSFGLSVAVSPLIGLVLNFTPLGVQPDPLLICLAAFTLACVAVASSRRGELPAEDRFSVDVRKACSAAAAKLLPAGEGRLDRALTVALFLCVLASVAVLAYAIAAPKQGEAFTEFYVLGPDGQADNYPGYFHLGDVKPVIVGVTDHEYRNVTYDLVVDLNDSGNVTQLYTTGMTLTDNQTWEQAVDLQPDQIGTNMEVRFLLYADGNTTAPYRDLHLWVNVTQPL